MVYAPTVSSAAIRAGSFKRGFRKGKKLFNPLSSP